MIAGFAKEGAKETGPETMLRISAKVLAVTNASGAFKAWVDSKTGLLLKLEMPAQTARSRPWWKLRLIGL
jgi:hypothetical protein